MTTETALAAAFPFAMLGIGLAIGYRLGKRACRRCARMLACINKLANGLAGDLVNANRAADAFERERDLLREQMAELSKQLAAEQMNSQSLLARIRPPQPVTLLT